MVLSRFIPILLSAVALSNAAQLPFRKYREGHSTNLKHFGVSDDPSHAEGKTFDYIVVGGGLTGLTVGMRLAEDPSTTVLIIEAGNDDRFDSLVRNVNRYREVFKENNGITWTWHTDHGKNITGYVTSLLSRFRSFLRFHNCGGIYTLKASTLELLCGLISVRVLSMAVDKYYCVSFHFISIMYTYHFGVLCLTLFAFQRQDSRRWL